jgi:20S proteasome alpha/beta subunit
MQFKRKRPDYSGLPMRTKRLNLSSAAAPPRTFCRMRRRSHTPYHTHGNLHFCINNIHSLTDAPAPASHQFWLHIAAGLCTSRPHFVTMQNSHKDLEKNVLAGVFGCKTYRKPKRKAPVTIAIGILCNNSIVVASDSRITYPDGTVRDDGNKIGKITFKDGSNAIVAQSGDDDLGSRIIENMGAQADDLKLNDWQSVSELANGVMLQEQIKLRAPFEGKQYTDAGFQQILRGFELSLIIAHYHNGKPYIFTSDFYPGRASRKRRSFVAIGCGSTLASFILGGFDFSKLNCMETIAAAIYAIDEVKGIDPRCGGKTQVAWCAPVAFKDEILIKCEHLGDSGVLAISKWVKKAQTHIKRNWNKKMRLAIQGFNYARYRKEYGIKPEDAKIMAKGFKD